MTQTIESHPRRQHVVFQFGHVPTGDILKSNAALRKHTSLFTLAEVTTQYGVANGHTRYRVVQTKTVQVR